jgi:hypothetical protein
MIEKLKLAPRAIAADKGEIFEALTQLANTLMELNGAILQQVVTMCRQVSDDGAEFEAVLKMQQHRNNGTGRASPPCWPSPPGRWRAMRPWCTKPCWPWWAPLRSPAKPARR